MKIDRMVRRPVSWRFKSRRAKMWYSSCVLVDVDLSFIAGSAVGGRLKRFL